MAVFCKQKIAHTGSENRSNKVCTANAGQLNQFAKLLLTVPNIFVSSNFIYQKHYHLKEKKNINLVNTTFSL